MGTVEKLCVRQRQKGVTDDDFVAGVIKIVEEEDRLEEPLARTWDDVLGEKIALHGVRVDTLIQKGVDKGRPIISAVDRRLRQLTEPAGQTP